MKDKKTHVHILLDSSDPSGKSDDKTQTRNAVESK